MKFKMPPKRFTLVFGTFLLAVLLYVDRACISAAKDDILAVLEVSGIAGLLGWDAAALTQEQLDKLFGWILSSFALGYALFQVPTGSLADRFGPRAVLTWVIGLWSMFTALTAAAGNFFTMIACRFLFGGSEAGAFPAMARACVSWIPMKERGIVTGINFSGSRLGAALALPLVSWLISAFGWQWAFVILGIVGLVGACIWFAWFRDDPAKHPGISKQELDYILENRQAVKSDGPQQGISLGTLFGSKNMWCAMGQYFASNFTFFFCLSWALPYLKSHYKLELVHAGFMASIPLLFGAAGNWFSGWLLDRIYKQGRWTLSRRLPAIMGFGLATLGIAMFVAMDNVYLAVTFLSLAIFGADMTLSPSWAFCMDIGKKQAGKVSGMMNMAGNIGSFVTPIAFPYMVAWTGSEASYFLLAAGLNLAAVGLWFAMKPDRPLEAGAS